MLETHGDRSIAQSIVDAIGASLLVLDQDLHVVAANGSYCRTFNVNRAETEGRHVSELGDGEWDIIELRQLLKSVMPTHRALEAYEVEGDFSNLGRRTMRIAAREMASQPNPMLLVEITDITAARSAESDARDLMERKEILVEEMSHRFANSLTMIAGILLLKAQASGHEEIRASLEETHHRIIAVAAVQRQLKSLVETDEVELGPYLTQLCESLTQSIIDDRAKISLTVRVGAETVSSKHAVHIGLLVAELVINALKHGYPSGSKGGHVRVAYDVSATGWTLTVSDDGIGKPDGEREAKSGLGTLIVGSLARQLDAEVNVVIDPHHGRSTSICHAA